MSQSVCNTWFNILFLSNNSSLQLSKNFSVFISSQGQISYVHSMLLKIHIDVEWINNTEVKFSVLNKAIYSGIDWA